MPALRKGGRERHRRFTAANRCTDADGNRGRPVLNQKGAGTALARERNVLVKGAPVKRDRQLWSATLGEVERLAGVVYDEATGNDLASSNARFD